MRRVSKSFFLVLMWVLDGGAARAGEGGQEDKDLSLIPPAVQTSPAPDGPVGGSTGRKIFVEEAFTQSWLRSALVPAPPPATPSWQERALLDMRSEWQVGQALRLTYSGRLNVRLEEGLGFPNHENLTHDLRETYLSWEPLERLYFDAGRVNLKSGVALGFNPTDFFKARAVVEPLSVDPVVLRDDRLGTLLLRAQRLWSGGSLTAAYIPAVASDSPIYTRLSLRGFNPMFDRTNAHEGWLLKGTIDINEGFSPELMAYTSQGRVRWGTHLAENIGKSVVAYFEWSGGRQGTVSSDALEFGRATGSLPADAASVLPDLNIVRFRNQLVVGASYTTELPKITFNLEFHCNQAGFSSADWDEWFRIGSGTSPLSPIARARWYVRDYAADQQELMSRRFAFLRMDWVDAFVPKLEVSGFIDTDLTDGSTRLQLGADYYYSDRWTIGGLVLMNAGRRHSDFGSLPQAGSVLLKAARYF